MFNTLVTIQPKCWHFWHNGHRVNVGLYHNKYDAAMRFRDLYGYLPDLDDVVNSLPASTTAA